MIIVTSSFADIWEYNYNNMYIFKSEFDTVPGLVKEYNICENEEVKYNNLGDTKNAGLMHEKKENIGKILSDAGYHILSDKMEYYLPTGQKVKVKSISFNNTGNIIWVDLDKAINILLPDGYNYLVQYLDFYNHGNISKAWIGELSQRYSSDNNVIIKDCIEFTKQGKISKKGIPESVQSAIYGKYSFSEIDKAKRTSELYIPVIGPYQSIAIRPIHNIKIILPSGEEALSSLIIYNGSGQIKSVNVDENTKIKMPNGLTVKAVKISYNGTGKITGVLPAEKVKTILPNGIEAHVAYFGFSNDGKVNLVRLDGNIQVDVPGGKKAIASSIAYDERGKVNEIFLSRKKKEILPNGITADVSRIKYDNKGNIYGVSTCNTIIPLPNGIAALVQNINFNSNGKITHVQLSESKEFKHEKVLLRASKGSWLLYNDMGDLVRIVSQDILGK